MASGMSNNAVAGFRLSSQQERVWFQQSANACHTVMCVTRLDGPVDADRLRRAAEKIVAEQEILRTVFRRQAGVKLPFQVIQDNVAFEWRRTRIQESDLHSEIATPWRFDLESGPVLQVTLAEVTNQRHYLIFRLPSLCADLATLTNLVQETARKYGSQPNDAASEVMQYADIVEWQYELLEAEDTRAGREFWREYCRSLEIATTGAALLPLEWKSRENSSLQRCERKCETTVAKESPSGVLLTCWEIMLSRLTGLGEITTAFECDGRKYEELKSAFGLFAKSIPLKTELHPEEPFSTLLSRVRESLGNLDNFQESFSWTLAEGQDASGPDLPFGFSYHELPTSVTGGEVRFEVVRQEAMLDRCKLKLVAERRGSEVSLRFEYDGSRYEPAAIERFAGYFQTLLAAAVANPETPVSRLPLLNAEQRRQILHSWNQTAAEYPSHCLHQLFEAQAARTPERPAVQFEDRTLSYRELNEQSNRLAHYLRSLGVAPDSPVGLCLERSAEMMVAMLGIVKAGGAYVPLNADNPKPRLAQQLAGAVALITESKLAAQMPEFSGQTLCMDRDQALWAQQPGSNPANQTNPDHLVYVIYTSGSTGVPKGVAVRHRNLVNYAHFITRRLELERFPEGLHFATVSTLGADLGNTCIFPALISGGCVHVISYEVSTDSQRFANYCERHPVDVLKIVPSHLQALLGPSDAGSVLPRQYLITGGESLTEKLLEKIESFHPGCELLNHYGPTETTVGSLTLRLQEYGKRSGGSSIPIGRPIANTRIYILDQHLEPVPVGVVGELYIGGAGVTAGYLNQPEKTAERFLTDPFVEYSDSKMYRTGDLARYQEDGNVEFLGRGDDQVKIRGFRIELGEIEAVLGKHVGVKQAVVLAREDEAGEKRLVGYVVPQREPSVSVEQLRSYLKEQLPEYMVPAAMVMLSKLPLNANGKIDRQALPAPEQAQTKTYVPPRTPTEEVLAGIWAEVLRLPRVGIEDDFFQIGGHSLLATQVISRVRRTLNIELPLRTLFEKPTVASLAAEVERVRRGSARPVPQIVRVSRERALPLSFAQQRLWVLDQLEPNNPLYNIPRALRMKGKLNGHALRRALNEIVRRHESQRSTFAIHQGQPVQVIAPALVMEMPVVDLRAGGENESRRLAGEEAQTPFDLSRGPLLRAKLLQLAPEDHLLLVTMHHIVSDAWSAGVFLNELSVLYKAFAAGEASPLPELPIQYADFAAWQRNWLQGEILEEQLKYWREQLRGAPPVLDIPADRARPKTQSFRGAYESIGFSPELAESMKSFARREGITLFMALVAGFQALLSRYSGEEQIVVGTDLANRTMSETEPLIGFFINLLALRTDLSGNPTFREILGRVREVTLGAYAHQDMPFDKLVEELQPERSLSHNPLVQVLFVMQNIPKLKRELPGLELSPFEMPITRSKFDFAVFMVEGEHGLTGNWLYSTDLFERASILRMAGHFETLLRNAIAEPDIRLQSLEFLSKEEREQLGAEKKERKQSQLKKLMSVEPKAISLAAGSAKGEES
jgi:amino acid adenylation domain-containing protein